VRQNTSAAPKVLNSWKEIASYLDRGVRTVQRWERELQLPVRRIGKGRRSPVYVLIPELNFWMSTSGVVHKTENPKPQLLQFPRTLPSSAQDSRRLLTSIQTLARNLAEASVRQHREAELLQKRIMEMKARMR
jgi:hypothetical protein